MISNLEMLVVGVTIGVLVWALRGRLAKSEIDGLKAQIGLHEQRIQLAKEQLEVSRRDTAKKDC